MSPSTRSSFTYEVLNDSETMLTVSFGNGQFGTSYVRTPTRSRIGSLTDWPLGEGSVLRGTTAHIRSLVADVNESTDLVSARYELCGGVTSKRVDLEDRIDSDGGSKVFEVTVQFV